MDTGISTVRNLLYVVLVLVLLTLLSNFYVASQLSRNSDELALMRSVLQKQLMGTALTQSQQLQERMQALNDSAAGIDAKNSFEDKILPVEQVYRRWGERVALIGGVDMNLLAAGDETQVRARTRQILDACGPGGPYVLGTGNSVANYLPLKNYQAMLDEGRKWNKAHFGREH